MLSFAGSLRVFLSVQACDLRKSFDGLYALAETELGENPRGGAIFVFCNRRRDRLKILYFDGSGLWVMTKRLEQGTFWWPKTTDPSAKTLKLAPEALAMLTDGIELRHGGKRAWYEENR